MEYVVRLIWSQRYLNSSEVNSIGLPVLQVGGVWNRLRAQV